MGVRALTRRIGSMLKYPCLPVMRSLRVSSSYSTQYANAPACDIGRSIWIGLETFVGSLKTHLLIYNEIRENSTVSTYLRSTNSLRSNTPPSSGKLVLNTPFRDAGVPACKETRRIYGISAGGRRMYWVNLSTWHNYKWTWLEARTNLSTLAWATIRL